MTTHLNYRKVSTAIAAPLILIGGISIGMALSNGHTNKAEQPQQTQVQYKKKITPVDYNYNAYRWTVQQFLSWGLEEQPDMYEQNQVLDTKLTAYDAQTIRHYMNLKLNWIEALELEQGVK
ncbi:hypothetical protein [Lactococcus phage Nocturne116]|nr:hypothetical protein [Lactococcus phage Nocturne116]